MEKKSDRIAKFVSSFENYELNNEQQAMLIGGIADSIAPEGNNCICSGNNCQCYGDNCNCY